MKWSQDDELALQALVARRGQVMDQHRANLKAVLAKVATPKFTECERVDAAVQHADELRDALLPFDSGTRLAK